MTDFIYTLCDPRDNRVRYVGKTDNPERRYEAHLREKAHTHRIYWIQSLLKLCLKPIMVILEQIPSGQNWEERERYWIKHFRTMYPDLTNMTDGGDCGPDCTGKHLVKSESGKRNIAAMLTKRNKTLKMREISRKNGLAQKGRKHSPETIEKLRQWMTGRKYHTDEFKRELAERNKTRQYDPEIMHKRSRTLWDDPIKGAEMRRQLAERNKVGHWRKGKKGNPPEVARENARRFWDDPIKSAEARRKLVERNKRRHIVKESPPA